MKTSTVLLKDEKVKSLGAVFDFGTEYTDVKVSCRSGNEAFIQDTPLSLSFCSPPTPLSPTSHCCPPTPSALETGNRLLTYKQEFEKKKKKKKYGLLFPTPSYIFDFQLVASGGTRPK